MARLHTTILAFGLLPLAISCDACGPVDEFAPAGAFEPALLDLGPVLDGESCEVSLTLVNTGGSELSVTAGELVDVSGDYLLNRVPQSVGLDGAEAVSITYTAMGTEGLRQSATVLLSTNDPDDDGEITATVTAIATDEAGALARLRCPDDTGALTECGAELAFGAVNIQDPIVPIASRTGLTKEVRVVNVGNAPMEVRAAVMNDGNPDFIVSSIERGGVLVPPESLPVILEPGAGSCGAPADGADNELTIKVFYSPTSLGADADTLLVLTNALEGQELELAVSGVGSDIGILLTPPTVSFGDTTEGSTATFDVLVSNLGTNDAPVNTTCIDLEDDGTCDFDCTGGDPALDGALNCEVFKSDGTHEGKGFILSPTDAVAGGDDERTVTLTWSPVAGNATIPASAMLRFETAILNNEVWKARIIGGVAGNLVAEADAGVVCGSGYCVPAVGDVGDVGTWTGTLPFTLRNDGQATVDITSFAFEGPPTIADDYELQDDAGNPIALEAPSISLAPGASVDLVLDYANDDASGADAINLIIEHTGINLRDTIPIQVTPPE